MKAFTITILLLAVIGQFTKASFSKTHHTKFCMETPMEDFGDDDAQKDSDNEEEDRTFYLQQVYSSEFVSEKSIHFTFYCFNNTEQIIEVVSPPPKG